MAFCPVAFCPVALCPVAFCPDTNYAWYAQAEYAERYNRRAKDKHFVEGDLVVVLAPPNAGKLYPWWCGPATVVKVKSLYNYLVDMVDSQIRHLHANKMR